MTNSIRDFIHMDFVFHVGLVDERVVRIND